MVKNLYIKSELLNYEYTEDKLLHLEHILENCILNLKRAATTVNFNQKEAINAFKIINGLFKLNKMAPIDINKLNLDTGGSTFISILNKRLTEILVSEDIDYSLIFQAPKNNMSNEDYEAIQSMIQDLRTQIKMATEHNKDLQKRLLDRLNKLQAQIDKDIGSLEEAKGIAITIADTMGYFNDKAFTPIINNVVRLTNCMRGVEAKSNGVTVQKTIAMSEEEDEIEDAEIINRENLLEKPTEV